MDRSCATPICPTAAATSTSASPTAVSPPWRRSSPRAHARSSISAAAWSRRPSSTRALPHGRDAVAGPAALEPLRHPARGHRAGGELKPQLTVEAVIRRALAYCDMAVAQACWPSAVTSTCDERLLAVDAPWVEAARRAVPRPQLVAFPAGRLHAARAPKRTCCARWTAAWTWSAASRTSSAAWPTARPRCGACAEIAAERGLRVDLHCDESDDPLSRHVETARRGDAAPRPAGPRRRLAPHVHAFHGQLLWSKLLPLMAETGVAV